MHWTLLGFVVTLSVLCLMEEHSISRSKIKEVAA